MKITIAYLPGEERKADLLKTIALGAIPGAKVKESDRHTPFKHIYLTSKKPRSNETPKGST